MSSAQFPNSNMERLSCARSFAAIRKPLHYLIAMLTILPSFVRAQGSASSKDQDNPYVISVSVSMVVLRATVEDRKNLLVSGLVKEDFQIFEDGVPQETKYFSREDVPVTVGLVIDNSGSMRTKRSDVIAAALAFARSSNPKDEMFVVNFNEKVSFALPENAPFTDNVSQLERALSRTTANGETALYDAVTVALDHLKKGSRDKKVLIVISDGGDNSSKQKLAQVVAMAKQSDAIIFTVGIYDEQDGDRNPGVLKRFAEDTGGEVFLLQAVKDVVPVCERIAHDIRSQYTLSYIPANKNHDGTYRVIQVKATSPVRGRLSVRTRAGYFAPSYAPVQTLKGLRHERQ